MKNGFGFFYILFLIIFFCGGWSFAGQTGKIIGRITDSATGEPLPGANVVVEGSNLGAASDVDGDFLILNLPPGSYTITASMLGYREVRMTGERVQADRSTRVDFHLQPATLELGEIITVEAERPIIQKDLTATASSISSDEIRNIPVENLQDLLVLQAGVVADKNGELHIRGGRSSEIAYLVDGISVTDPFSGKKAIDIDQNNIQELKVISGTFNAEYGQVMSGIVEVVTKDPEYQTRAGVTVYSGDYLSSHSSLFYNVNTVKPADVYNLQFYLTGPLPLFKKRVSYYLSLRKFYNDGWLYGVRRYNPSDSAHFEQDGAYIEQTGDNQPVPMNFSREYYGNLKLVFKLSNTAKLSYNLLGNNFARRFYNHLYRLNPDGDKTNYNYGISNILNLNHTLSPTTFYTLKLSHFDYRFKSYLYENPDDPRYVNPELLITREDAYSFLTGGTNMIHEIRSTAVNNGKFDITSQVSKVHQLKSGVEVRLTRIEENNFEANYRGVPNGGIFSTFSFLKSGRYHHNAVEAAAYLQDKIELDNMTVNIGLRYDYFDPRGVVPRYLNDPDSAFTPASVKHQLSPRIGLAFPISSAGVIHASYGHFFQIPPYEFLYQNPRFAVNPGGLSTLMGNADLKPQTTIIYEFGIQQEIFPQVGIDLTGFYKDARNLLGTKIYNAGGGDRYARYENRDYGNIRGITFSLNKRPTASDHVTVSFDYTFQVAEGNASDPKQEFYNQQSEPPKKSNIQVVPLNWDQTHTINLSLSYSHPKILTAGIIGQFQSGLPYTPAIQSLETTFENSGRKPFNYNVDLRLSKIIPLWGKRFKLFLKVYNLFDRRNEMDVYQDTGRAGYSLVSHYTGERNAHVNTLDEWLQRPDFYSEPRKMLFGFRLEL